MKVSQLMKIMKVLRQEIGHSKDIPQYWAEFFLAVGESGNRGILTKELSEELDITQGIASRLVKLMSTYKDKDTGKIEGRGLFTTFPDDEYRHRQRVVLSGKGKEVMIKIERMLEE